MIYSKTSEYAIRALGYLALRAETSPATAKEVSRGTGVSQAYVAKIFQCLVRDKILRSHRGVAGGFSLAVDPSKLMLIRVVSALDDKARSPLSQCVMGFSQCNDTMPCALHDTWVTAKKDLIGKLSTRSIMDAAICEGDFKKGKQGRHVLSKQMRSVFKT